MKKEENPWSQAIVLVCTKCHKSIDASLLKQEGNAGENLRNYLKDEFRQRGELDKVRIVTSSCLDICEANLQAVTYAGVHGETETFTLHPENEREELLKYVSGKIS